MEKIIILDYGSQFNQLIARRIREQGVYSEVHAYQGLTREVLFDESVKGIILSGGPQSVYDQDSYPLPEMIFERNVPILGICYGMQLIHQYFQGRIEPAKKREYGKTTIDIELSTLITKGLEPKEVVWMSHGDHVQDVGPDFEIIGKSQSAIALARHKELPIYTMQFHPEVTHTFHSNQWIQNFLFEVCHVEKNWKMDTFITETISEIRKTVGDKKVILALSGGVDSSVCGMLIHQAIQNQLTCVFVDTGLLRKEEKEEVVKMYHDHFQLNVEVVDAKEQFYQALKGVKDPEKKRKIIGKQFFDVFEEAKQKHQDAYFLAQGTIYPDVIESSHASKQSKVIKSHHNVGGIPSHHTFEILEPLRTLFKDEVREIGLRLGIPKKSIYRHPFPGPGLGIRVIGEITKRKVKLLQEADHIFIQMLYEHGLYDHIGQAFVCLLPVKTVGVMGDNRTYEYVCSIRAVESTDFMTANISRLPWAFLEEVSNQIINQVKGINRVVYDITSKPPGTIEWE